jgi:hypothetical protein
MSQMQQAELGSENREYWRRHGRKGAFVNLEYLCSRRGVEEFGLTAPGDMAGFLVSYAYWWLETTLCEVRSDGCGEDYIRGVLDGVEEFLEASLLSNSEMGEGVA